MLDPVFNERRVDQDSEFRALQVEGKRRQREWEGIPIEPNMLGRYKVGSHKMPGSGPMTEEAIDKAQAAADEGFAIYPLYSEGLERELADLVRDAELMEKHETVKYE